VDSCICTPIGKRERKKLKDRRTQEIKLPIEGLSQLGDLGPGRGVYKNTTTKAVGGGLKLPYFLGKPSLIAQKRKRRSTGVYVGRKNIISNERRFVARFYFPYRGKGGGGGPGGGNKESKT